MTRLLGIHRIFTLIILKASITGWKYFIRNIFHLGREREQQRNGGKYLVAEEKQKRRERRIVFGKGKYLVSGENG